MTIHQQYNNDLVKSEMLGRKLLGTAESSSAGSDASHDVSLRRL